MLGLITGFLFFNWTDFLITPIYIYIIAKWFNSFVKKEHGSDPHLVKLLTYAFWFKIAGSIFINCIYEFYYKGGDVEGYFYGGGGIYNSFFENPLYTIEMLLSSATKFKSFITMYGVDFEMAKYVNSRHYFNTPELTAIKMSALVSFLCFHTYTTIGIFFSMFAFAGSYKLFVMLKERYPDMVTPITICCFFIPTVIVWGGGVLKDPLTYGATCFIVYYLNLIFVKRKFKLINYAYLFASAALVVLIKPYIFMCLTPAVFFYVLISYARSIKSKYIFVVLIPIVVLTTAILSFALISILKKELGKFSLENLQNTMENFQSWHAAEALISGGSGYTLGEMDFSTTGLLKKIPLAINVTFFRPYLWESRKPIILLSAFESLFVFLFFMRTLFRAGIRLFFQTIFSDPFITFCIIFAIIFGTAVGLTSYNFGALARYKIPAMPFFLFAIYLIDNQYKAKKVKVKKGKKAPKKPLTAPDLNTPSLP